MRAPVRDVHVVVGADLDGLRVDEVGVDGGATVALVPREGRAAEVVDDAALVDAPHVVVP